MVLSCAVENSYEPMRFAGTWKQYSKNAIPQLARMTFHSGSLRYLRWPYQAKVIKIFDTIRSRMVRKGMSPQRDRSLFTRSLVGIGYAHAKFLRVQTLRVRETRSGRGAGGTAGSFVRSAGG